MGSMIDLLVCLILTTTTGSIFLGFWMALKKLVEKRGCIEWLYRLLWPVVFLFFLPLEFFRYAIWFQVKNRDAGFPLFWGSPTVTAVCERAAWIWFCGAVLLLIYYGMDFLRSMRHRRQGIRCGERKYRVFCQALKQLGISEEKVELCESYHVSVPMVTGLWRAKVLLPVENYGEEELRIILLHELSHYKQKDLWLKHILQAVVILQWFNPAVWFAKAVVWRWSEYACDYRVCRETGGIKHYFSVILSQTEPAWGWTGGHLSALFRDKHELLKRVEKMKICFKKEWRPKRRIYGLCVVLLLLGMVSAHVSSDALLSGYVWWEDTTAFRGEDIALEEE